MTSVPRLDSCRVKLPEATAVPLQTTSEPIQTTARFTLRAQSAEEKSRQVESTYPEFANRIHVVAAIIERDGRFLLCRRNPLKRHGGLWEFPGGKLESGENHCDAAKRELYEEL